MLSITHISFHLTYYTFHHTECLDSLVRVKALLVVSKAECVSELRLSVNACFLE